MMLLLLLVVAMMARVSGTARHLSGSDNRPIYGTLPKPEYYMSQQFHFVHIPKTAGESVDIDAPIHMPIGSQLMGGEYGYGYFLKNKVQGLPNESFVVFLRNPLSHVLSQFLECKYDTWGRKVTKNTNFPGYDQTENVMDGFDEWVSHFAQYSPPYNYKIDERFSYGCYNPWNMQARYMTTQSKQAQIAKSEADRLPSIDEAQQNLEQVPVVGITEHYEASMCLLEFQALGGDLSPKCRICNQSSHVLETAKEHHHAEHHVPAHNVNMIKNETIKLIVDELTAVDNELYSHALKLFHANIRHVYERIGVDLLCGEYYEHDENEPDAAPMDGAE